MIAVQLDAVSLARVRLAVSPAAELTAWLRLAATGRRHPVFGDPGASARYALRHRDVLLLAHVMPPGGTGYTLDLLTPKPSPGVEARALSRQLEAVAETSAESVVRQLRVGRFPTGRMPTDVHAAMDSGTFARRAANGLHQFWTVAVADRWPAVRATLEADLANRATLMASRGVGHVLDSLHPSVLWTGTRLQISKPYEELARLDGAELVLAPSALGWPVLSAQICDPTDAVLAYPASGIGSGVVSARAAALSGLVGASRAAVLRDLDVPRSTSELSTRQSLAPATVSYHLGVLLRAGLVLRTRDRHVVLYRRSEQGDALLGDRF